MGFRHAHAFVLGLAVLPLTACAAFLPGQDSRNLPPAAPRDPTPLAKCQVAANAASPLVTEWPASEKAHLQSLAAGQVVAVEYSGCDLRIVDSCRLSGAYGFRRTTLATDVVEIENADELYAKLPIGALSLEGELSRSGRLAVRSTVAGQLVGGAIEPAAFDTPACREATHYVSAISIGTFQLLSGDDVSGRGGAGIAGVSAGSSARRREVVLREAGSRESCSAGTDQAPHPDCASPIQVFLTEMPAHRAAVVAGTTSEGPVPGAVHIAFPSLEEDEVWTLRAPGGRVLCKLPCDQDVGPVSGNYLQREPRNGASAYVLPLPQSFPHPVGSKVTAEYRAERGNPQLSMWAFLGSIPMGLGGVGITTWGVVQATGHCERRGISNDCFPGPGLLIGMGVFLMAMTGASAWWYLYSHEEGFTTYEDLPPRSSGSAPGVQLGLSPGGILGTF